MCLPKKHKDFLCAYFAEHFPNNPYSITTIQSDADLIPLANVLYFVKVFTSGSTILMYHLGGSNQAFGIGVKDAIGYYESHFILCSGVKKFLLGQTLSQGYQILFEKQVYEMDVNLP